MYECKHQTSQLNTLFARSDCAASFTIDDIGCADLGVDARYVLPTAATTATTKPPDVFGPHSSANRANGTNSTDVSAAVSSGGTYVPQVITKPRYSLVDATGDLDSCNRRTAPGLSAMLREITEFDDGLYNGIFFDIGCRQDLSGKVHIMLAVRQANDAMATGESRSQLLAEAFNELISRQLDGSFLNCEVTSPSTTPTSTLTSTATTSVSTTTSSTSSSSSTSSATSISSSTTTSTSSTSTTRVSQYTMQTALFVKIVVGQCSQMSLGEEFMNKFMLRALVEQETGLAESMIAHHILKCTSDVAARSRRANAALESTMIARDSAKVAPAVFKLNRGIDASTVNVTLVVGGVARVTILTIRAEVRMMYMPRDSVLSIGNATSDLPFALTEKPPVDASTGYSNTIDGAGDIIAVLVVLFVILAVVLSLLCWKLGRRSAKVAPAPPTMAMARSLDAEPLTSNVPPLEWPRTPTMQGEPPHYDANKRHLDPARLPDTLPPISSNLPPPMRPSRSDGVLPPLQGSPGTLPDLDLQDSQAVNPRQVAELPAATTDKAPADRPPLESLVLDEPLDETPLQPKWHQRPPQDNGDEVEDTRFSGSSIQNKPLHPPPPPADLFDRSRKPRPGSAHPGKQRRTIGTPPPADGSTQPLWRRGSSERPDLFRRGPKAFTSASSLQAQSPGSSSVKDFSRVGSGMPIPRVSPAPPRKGSITALRKNRRVAPLPVNGNMHNDGASPPCSPTTPASPLSPVSPESPTPPTSPQSPDAPISDQQADKPLPQLRGRGRGRGRPSTDSMQGRGRGRPSTDSMQGRAERRATAALRRSSNDPTASGKHDPMRRSSTDSMSRGRGGRGRGRGRPSVERIPDSNSATRRPSTQSNGGGTRRPSNSDGRRDSTQSTGSVRGRGRGRGRGRPSTDSMQARTERRAAAALRRSSNDATLGTSAANASRFKRSSANKVGPKIGSNVVIAPAKPAKPQATDSLN